MQNNFRDGIKDTIETPKIGSLPSVADTSKRISIHLLRAAKKRPFSGPGGNSLTVWSLAMRGGVRCSNSKKCANLQEEEVCRTSAQTPQSYRPFGGNSVNKYLLNAYCMPGTLLGALHRYLS